MNITEQIDVLELKVGSGDNSFVIHPFVIYDEGQAILFDTGFPGNYDSLVGLLNPAIPVRAVVLTHRDLDHVGTLPQFLTRNSGLAVYAHEGDCAAINGRELFVKGPPERLDMVLSQVSADEAKAFRYIFSADSPDNVTHVLQDGEMLPFAGGLQAIHTPGHTPGHTSFYHPGSKTLFTGDAMNIVDGQLVGPAPQFTPNLEQAIDSLNKFKELDVGTVVCYHGGIFKGNFQQRLNELVSGS